MPNPTHYIFKRHLMLDNRKNHLLDFGIRLPDISEAKRVTAAKQQNAEHIDRGSLVAVQKTVIQRQRMYKRRRFLFNWPIIATIRPCQGRLDRAYVTDSRQATVPRQYQIMRSKCFFHCHAIMTRAYLSANRLSARSSVIDVLRTAREETSLNLPVEESRPTNRIFGFGHVTIRSGITLCGAFLRECFDALGAPDVFLLFLLAMQLIWG